MLYAYSANGQLATVNSTHTHTHSVTRSVKPPVRSWEGPNPVQTYMTGDNHKGCLGLPEVSSAELEVTLCDTPGCRGARYRQSAPPVASSISEAWAGSVCVCASSTHVLLSASPLMGGSMGSVIRLAVQPVLPPCPAAPPELLTLLAAAAPAEDGPAPALGISSRGAHAAVLTLSQDAGVPAGGRAARFGGKVRRVPAAVASFAAADARSAAAAARLPAAAASCVEADRVVRAVPLL